MQETVFSYSSDFLNEGLVNQVRLKAGYEETTDHRVLMNFGFISDSGSEHTCCLEALLLFASEFRSRFHPRAGVRVYTVDGTEKREIPDADDVECRRFDGPLLSMVDEVFRYVSEIIGRSAQLYSLFLREMPEYPEDAWHEFIINAVVHRNYAVRGRETEIWIFNDRIEIESPGRLYDGITVEDLIGTANVHSSRNPRLADIFVKTGYMREIGEGISRVCRSMEKSYLNPPLFEETQTGLRVTLENSPVFDVGDSEWEQKIKSLDLNLNQKRILIIYREGTFSNSDYQQINMCDRDTAYREILDIVDKGYLRKQGKGRGLTYIPDIH